MKHLCKSVVIHYLPNGKTDPDNIKASLWSLNDNASHYRPTAFMDSFWLKNPVDLMKYNTDKVDGGVYIDIDEFIREVPDLHEYIRNKYQHRRIINIVLEHVNVEEED